MNIFNFRQKQPTPPQNLPQKPPVDENKIKRTWETLEAKPGTHSLEEANQALDVFTRKGGLPVKNLAYAMAFAPERVDEFKESILKTNSPTDAKLLIQGAEKIADWMNPVARVNLMLDKSTTRNVKAWMMNKAVANPLLPLRFPKIQPGAFQEVPGGWDALTYTENVHKERLTQNSPWARLFKKPN